ncbi:hypothetical protein [Croceivirga thetidis]|uniref:Ferric oxidoreductase domain-containing protein n=1 Tax=Croceivirga thetidis TaxID=2721623 RepID=A0ABX1GPE8_9FLAO|nr:hypothetical protein [Croceivirga thetidis]NKI31802.1 hypothetical protein [Croceivirga thetidis]
MRFSLRNLLLLGVLAEIIIFGYCYLTEPNLNEVFRHSARFSGRLSFIIFLGVFVLFAFGYPRPIRENHRLRNWLLLFAVLHLIHFGFLATNIYLNDIPLVPKKLAGGALAYLMIVLAPFVLHKVKLGFQLVYFYYVGIVMGVTYLARIRGDFQGAEPFWFHHSAIGILIGFMLYFGIRIFRTSRTKNSP